MKGVSHSQINTVNLCYKAKPNKQKKTKNQKTPQTKQNKKITQKTKLNKKVCQYLCLHIKERHAASVFNFPSDI